MLLNLEKALEIQSYMPQPEEHDLPWLAEQAQGCSRILELGTYLGASTRAMLDNSDARIWCIDSWCGSGTGTGLVPSRSAYYRFLDNLQDLRHRITVLKMFTKEAKGLLPKDFFDMVFIDADHSYEAVRSDILNFAPLLKLGGLLCGHDYNSFRRKGLIKAVSELVPSHRLAGQMIWWARKDEAWSWEDIWLPMRP